MYINNPYYFTSNPFIFHFIIYKQFFNRFKKEKVVCNTIITTISNIMIYNYLIILFYYNIYCYIF